MNIKKISFLSFILIINLSNSAFGMNQKIISSTQDALKNSLVKQFDLSKATSSSLDTLIAYNKNSRNNLMARLLCAVPVVSVGTLLQIKSMYDDFYVIGRRQFSEETLFRPTEKQLLLCTTFCLASLLYIGKQGCSAYTRQWMIRNLQMVKNNNSNFFDKQRINAVVQKDIKNRIHQANIVPLDKKTNTTIALDVNNDETLSKILTDKFNKRECTLTVIK